MPNKNKKQNELENKTEETALQNTQPDAIKSGNSSLENFHVVFSWETVDIIKNPLLELYMAIAVIASMGMIAWGLYTRSFTVVLVFVMLAAVIILMLNEEPKKLKVKISEKGIDVNDTHYGFGRFKSFSISYAPVYGAEPKEGEDEPESSEQKEIAVLNLNPRKSYLPAQTIYIENEPEKDIEDFLEIYLPKEEEEKKE